jgi:hypothetical protein
MWQPRLSTLLQVFISIQSMILCPKPYYNEPGRVEPSGRDSASENFNNYVKVQCVRYAMLDWLTDPDKRSGIWRESPLLLYDSLVLPYADCYRRMSSKSISPSMVLESSKPSPSGRDQQHASRAMIPGMPTRGARIAAGQGLAKEGTCLMNWKAVLRLLPLKTQSQAQRPKPKALLPLPISPFLFSGLGFRDGRSWSHRMDRFC